MQATVSIAHHAQTFLDCVRWHPNQAWNSWEEIYYDRPDVVLPKTWDNPPLFRLLLEHGADPNLACFESRAQASEEISVPLNRRDGSSCKKL
jgi:hypothetical protein